MSITQLIELESGSWEAPEDLVKRALSELDSRLDYDSEQIYRIITPESERDITKQILKQGVYKPSEKLKENEFWAAKRDEVADFYEILDANKFAFAYIAVFDPRQVEETSSNLIYEYNDPNNRIDSVKAFITIKND